MSVDRSYFTLVFKGDIGNYDLNPMNTKTPFGYPAAAGRGDAFEEADRLRGALEDIASLNVDPEIDRIASEALSPQELRHD
jgi:hypothetical protein